jgi:AraC-like DNA-binding protein
MTYCAKFSGVTMASWRKEPDRDATRDPVYLFGSTMRRPYRLAYGLAPIIEILEEHAHPIAPLLASAGIPRFALEEPSYRIRFEQELTFIRLALARLNLPAAGLAVGQRDHLPLFGVMGLAASCAPTVRDLFRTVPAFPTLAWGSIELSVWGQGRDEYVAFHENDEVGDCAEFFVLRDTTAVLTLFRQTLGASVMPLRVRLRQQQPADPTPYTAFFGRAVSFGDTVNQIHFAAAVWEAVPPQANAMSYRFFSNQCRRLSEVMHEPLSYADVVRARLRTATPVPALEEVVDALHLSRRTLQRRLSAEDTSFAALLEEVRLERAVELMRRSGMHNDELAYCLGFEDGSAFSRAFKTWTGESPQAFRLHAHTEEES